MVGRVPAKREQDGSCGSSHQTLRCIGGLRPASTCPYFTHPGIRPEPLHGRAVPLRDCACPTQSICLHLCLSLHEAGAQNPLKPQCPPAQGLGGVRTQDGARTSCLSSGTQQERGGRGGRPAGVLKRCRPAAPREVGGGSRPNAKPPPHPGTPWASSLPPPPSLPPPDHPGIHPSCLCPTAAFPGLALGLTHLPLGERAAHLSPSSGRAKTLCPTRLQREQAAKACFEYQGFPKIKKGRKVFWKHLMCQLIKCLIINKLPPRRRGKAARILSYP